MTSSDSNDSLCGLWISPEGKMHRSFFKSDGTRYTDITDFHPFLWCEDPTVDEQENTSHIQTLEGDQLYSNLLTFDTLEAYKEFQKAARKKTAVEIVRPLEHQYLLHHAERMFAHMTYSQLKRCQCDIETACSIPGGFSNPRRAEDRILAIGLHCDGDTDFILLEEDTDAAERKLLEAFNQYLADKDPDTIEGHNIFKFDLNYIRFRCKHLKVPCAWGRFGAKASFRNSRLKVAERWLDYPRCDIPGRTIVDTFFMIMLFDITTRDLPSYSLKDVALYFDITQADTHQRTYLKAEEIQQSYYKDRDTFLAYLSDDLRETGGIADLLLPTYFAQSKNFAMSLQETILRGTGSKVDALFLEKYYHAKRSLPVPMSIQHFAGGYTRSFEIGVFKKILHFDVASLYPSLMMLIDRNPFQDSLGAFIPMLKELREYRLKYKQLARETEEPSLRREYEARQSSYKILINSFYGYLGFEGARFADSELAAEITERGRELLQNLIEAFQSIGCKVLEADTDGIYLSSEAFFEKPEELLEKVSHVLPKGIELECSGSYESMFCYKAKNYALYDGKRVIIRGSALRSRGIEAFLKGMTDHLIHHLLGTNITPPHEHIEALREEISSGSMDIQQLAKREYLSQNPEAYAKAVESGNKPRRASLEVALQMKEPRKAGDQVAYYITRGEKKRMPDWQVARALDDYDPEAHPYNPDYYLKKLKDWQKRYEAFLEMPSEQGELFS